MGYLTEARPGVSTLGIFCTRAGRPVIIHIFMAVINIQLVNRVENFLVS